MSLRLIKTMFKLKNLQNIFLSMLFILILINSSKLIAQKALFSWGDNLYGQLGDGTTNQRNSPEIVGSSTDWSKIYAFKYHCGGIKTNGTLWMWGANGNGQLGNGNTTQQNSPIQIGAATNWQKISIGAQWTLGLKSDGTLWYWGLYGASITPTQLGTDTDWADIDAGEGNLALKTNGTLWSWGNNPYGQLGNGTNSFIVNPTQVGTDTDWSKIAIGETAAFAIKTNGTLWGAGNGGGLVGIAAPAAYSFQQIGVATNWSEVSVSSGNIVIGLRTNGTIYTWGGGVPLGDGVNSNSTVPIQIGTDTDWVEVSASEVHFMARKSNGTLWAWGGGGAGNIGIGNTSNVNIPTQITTNTTWNNIAGGQFFSLALITVSLPTLNTNLVNNVTYNSAIASGSITNTGGTSISARGFVWSKTINPSINNYEGIVYSSSTINNFSENITKLQSKSTYYIRAFATNSQGTAYGNNINITTNPSLEDFAPNNGDGNGDGVPDSQQDNVTSFRSPISNQFITVVSLDGYEIQNLENNSPIKDSKYTYIGGLLKFKVNASQARIKVYYHNFPSLKGFSFRKMKTDSTYFNLPNVITKLEIIGGREVAIMEFNLNDGGPEDFDGIINGSITDPGGAAILTTDYSIPTLSEWARIFMLSLLIAFGVWFSRKRIV